MSSCLCAPSQHLLFRELTELRNNFDIATLPLTIASLVIIAELVAIYIDLWKGLENLKILFSVSLSERRTKSTEFARMFEHMSHSLEDNEKLGSLPPSTIPPGHLADEHDLQGNPDWSDCESMGSTLVSEISSSDEQAQQEPLPSPLHPHEALREDAGPSLPYGLIESTRDPLDDSILDEILLRGALRFPALYDSPLTVHLSLILTRARTSRCSFNVRTTIEHPATHQALVAVHDADGITYSQDMRLDGRDLECNNTSPALDHATRVASGFDANEHKSTLLDAAAPEMPALLAYDDSPYAIKGSQPPTRLIGVVSSKSLRHRKAGKAHHRAASAVSWTVKRLLIDRDPGIDIWQTGEVLGEGTYGQVHRVCNKLTGSGLAMKVIDIDRPLPRIMNDGLINELLVLEILSYERGPLPYLLRPTSKRSWAWCSPDRFLCTLTEYCPGGQLSQYAGNLTGPGVRQILAELVVGIETLHRLGIVHHDLKPENVLIDADGHVVIADYGGAKFLDEDGLLSLSVQEDVLSTLPYTAPEIVSVDCDEHHMKYYDESIDWWALGAIIMTLVTGDEYFVGTTMDELCNNIPYFVQRIQKTLRAYRCSEALIDLTEGLLTEDPEMRLRISDIKNHFYFSNVDWRMVESRSSELVSPFFPGCTPSEPIRPVDRTNVNWPSPDENGEMPENFGDFIEELRRIGLDLEVDDTIKVPC